MTDIFSLVMTDLFSFVMTDLFRVGPRRCLIPDCALLSRRGQSGAGRADAACEAEPAPDSLLYYASASAELSTWIYAASSLIICHRVMASGGRNTNRIVYQTIMNS